MSSTTGINWADHTFNPWEGCSKVSAGCKNCYAEARDKRELTEKVSHWGKGAPRRVTSDANWKEPLRWNKQAAKAGTRPRVFCASLADVFDNEAPEGQRDRLWALIKSTPNLDWLLLTKRPGNIRKYLPIGWGRGYPNVWLGVSVENRKQGLPRIYTLLQIPAVIHFISVEPLLEDLGKNLGMSSYGGIDWAIIGGETGTKARSMDISWVRSFIAECRRTGVAPWVKQLGKIPTNDKSLFKIIQPDGSTSGNGENWDEWPEDLSDLKVRELPKRDLHTSAIVSNNVELVHIESALAQLAASASLTQSDAEKELRLRSSLVETEGKLFLTRLEKGRILAGYKALYGPLRLWSEFCKIVDIPRQTAYDLLTAADPETIECANGICTDSVQLPTLTREEIVVIKAEKTLTRMLRKLDKAERKRVMDELYKRFIEQDVVEIAA